MSKTVINYKTNNEEWKIAVDKAFEKLNKKAKIDGFREGKAPRSVFEKKYGKENIFMEASEILIHERYHKIFEDDKLEPIIEPKVDIVKMDEFGLEANFTIWTKPEITLGSYKNLNVKKEEVKITKEEINNEIKSLTEKYAEIVPIDGPVKKNDTAIIDFEGFNDGIPFEGGKATNYSLEIGSNSFIPGFEDGLIGMKKGEEKDLNLKFPENYQAEELKGKTVVFKVKVNEIKERVVPELNENFFADLGIDNVTTKETLEKHIEEELMIKKEYELENKYIDELLKKASDNLKVEIEEEVIQDEANRMYNQFMERMSYQGLTEELYLQYTNSKKEDLLKQMHSEALNRIKERYLLESIVEKENIDVSENEVLDEINSMSKKYNMEKEELIKAFGGIDVVKYDLKMKKAISIIKKNN